MQHYDFIISGMGCAGLSLAVNLIESGKFTDKKILLIDKDSKSANDRTWCFWEKGKGWFEEIVSKKWSHVWFHGEDYSKLLNLNPYQYKLIRGIDFYSYCMDKMKKHGGIEIRNALIKSIHNEDGKVIVETEDGFFTGEYVFNSILFSKPVISKKENYLLQHFKGWVIETEKDAFNPEQATLMDFRVDQAEGTCFLYIMPFSSTKALMEYTVFSKNVLEKDEYEKQLRNYLVQYLPGIKYRIAEEEYGIIPMTDHRFPIRTGNIINIGTAGGQTKASTGYTFNFIQKHSATLVDQLVKTGHPFLPKKRKSRHGFYDSVLLDVLSKGEVPGKTIFTRIFRKNKPQAILRFLDNESSIADETGIISSLPSMPFLKAAWRQL